MCTTGGARTNFKILEKAFQKYPGKWYLKINMQTAVGDYEEEIALADFGIIPTSDGFWNTHCWFEKP